MNFGTTPAKQLALEQRMTACGLKESDLDESFIRSSGPGGQNVNKTATAVYLKHIPTGLEVKCTRSRSQLLNRFYARRQLCELLEQKTLGTSAPKNLAARKIRKQKDRRRRRAQKSPLNETN
jgi:protein subunit release factor B